MNTTGTTRRSQESSTAASACSGAVRYRLSEVVEGALTAAAPIALDVGLTLFGTEKLVDIGEKRHEKESPGS